MPALFVYGTLRDSEVQHQLLGRDVPGHPDTLRGYRRDMTVFPPYPVALPNPDAEITGVVLTITNDELLILDDYEGASYQRIEQTLVSGALAWVYVGA